MWVRPCSCSYVAKDMVQEYQKFDSTPSKFKQFSGVHGRTKEPWSCDIGYEQFLAPELFFNPEIYSEQFATPLPQVVDEVVLASPIDCRRRLYSVRLTLARSVVAPAVSVSPVSPLLPCCAQNIVLSGGSTLYKNFHKRLEGEIQDRVNTRLRENMARISKSTGVTMVRAGGSLREAASMV